ncbi:hypothetical protein F5Y16DRAFT_307000 [Xylariaceae sp. FL0255]|nr:hypothetical protein F5Y16DRAFT_307000 [Xylariaceae sp. FL0255]
MDSSGSLSTYKRYKLGQLQFQRWLQQTSERLTRKGAADQPRTAKAPTSASVHWSQLENMAKIVIDNEAPENIPPSAISILKDVVGLRKKSAKFFAAAAKPGDEKAQLKNAAHAHIIKVLDNILKRFEGALSTITPSPPPTSASASGGQLGVSMLNNMFEHLTLENTQQGGDDENSNVDDTDALESLTVKAPSKPKKSQKKSAAKGKKQKKPSKALTASGKQQNHNGDQGSWVDKFQWFDQDQEDDDEFDYYMLIYCFFQDYNEVRGYVSDKWCEYFYQKSISVDTLAVVTNAACELFHELEAELHRAIRKMPDGFAAMGNYAFMMKTLFFDYGLDHVDYSGEDQLTEEERFNKIYYEADWVGFLVYALVEDVLSHVPPGKVPMIPPSAKDPIHYGLHDAEGMRGFMRSVVADIFPEICITKALKTNGLVPHTAPAQDELTLGFEQLFRVRDYPSTMIFSLSLYVDIRYILEEQVSDAFELLQATAASSKAILEQYLPQIKNRREFKRDCQDRLHELKAHIIDDFTFYDKERRFREGGITEPVERHSLLKRDPIWAGLLDLRCRLVLSDLGLRFVKDSPLVAAAAFVYAAAQVEGRDSTSTNVEWPRMDIFLRVHGRDQILKGAVTEEDMAPVALLKRFVDLNLAVSGTDLSGSPNKSLEALTQRYCWDGNRSRWSVGHLRSIVQERSSSAVNTTQGQEQQQQQLQLVPSNRKDEQSQSTSTPVSPIQLLEIVEETTASLLENELSVEYFQLYDECILLFLELLEEFATEAGEFSYNEGSHSDELALFVPVLYRVAVATADQEHEPEKSLNITQRLARAVVGLCNDLSEDAAR